MPSDVRTVNGTGVTQVGSLPYSRRSLAAISGRYPSMKSHTCCTAIHSASVRLSRTGCSFSIVQPSPSRRRWRLPSLPRFRAMEIRASRFRLRPMDGKNIPLPPMLPSANTGFRISPSFSDASARMRVSMSEASFAVRMMVFPSGPSSLPPSRMRAMDAAFRC